MPACKARKTRRKCAAQRTANGNNINGLIAGGEGGIRTHGTVTRTTVFETVVLSSDWYGRQS